LSPLPGGFARAPLIGDNCVMHPQKITLGEMRQSGLRRVLVYCADYRISHSVTISAKAWSDDIRLSDLEPRFTCQVCGHRR
jgi:hypothetical protein